MSDTNSGIEVTVRDTETGDTETQLVPVDDYVIVCAGKCHVDQVQEFANGTQQLTVKGRRGTGMTITVHQSGTVAK